MRSERKKRDGLAPHCNGRGSGGLKCSHGLGGNGEDWAKRRGLIRGQ